MKNVRTGIENETKGKEEYKRNRKTGVKTGLKRNVYRLRNQQGKKEREKE